MFGQESTSQPALVLVAPMPRRPIALVARRQSRYQHGHQHSLSSSRSTRNATLASTTAVSAGTLSSQGSTPAASTAAALSDTSDISTHSTTRHIAHPYSRSKTPSNVSNPCAGMASLSVSASAIGLGLSPAASPLLQDLTGLRSPSKDRDFTNARRRKSFKDAADNSTDSLLRLTARTPNNNIHSASKSLESTQDNLMAEDDHAPAESIVDADSEAAAPTFSAAEVATPGSPPSGGTANCLHGRVSSDVDRTPTKRGLKQLMAQMSPSAGSGSGDPKSTPTIGPESPKQQDSPSLQRAQANDEATIASLKPLSGSTSVPQSTTASPSVAAALASSMVPSPCLSDSRSRSPSASPSPCPSPEPGRDQRPSLSPAPHWLHGGIHSADMASALADDLSDKPRVPLLLEEKRKLGLPLPMPTSPIPRKMTRNPFERYLSFPHTHQHLQHNARQTRLGLSFPLALPVLSVSVARQTCIPEIRHWLVGS
ncbi:hypothetical protein BCV70DRAFT_212088 [Testicularia cyperi]|uniref:Uncharacterized protein n=1 Tax=Testicularia cyperi TaxID=1882483 RepID=A0A317XNG2_9BASI|nr:hypothetical protein BCV70DRAFT_212088 [Testicularia cyperi]